MSPLEEQLNNFRKDNRKRDEIQFIEAKINQIDKEVHEGENLVADVDAKVFDLKAVNSSALAKVNAHTTVEVIDSIQTQTLKKTYFLLYQGNTGQLDSLPADE